MRETMTLGPVPAEEDCAQVGQAGYREQALRECRAYKAQLVRQFGEPPEGAGLAVRGHAHDFGTYYEVEVSFQGDNEQAMDYAFRCEGEAWGNWDETAKRELGL